MSVGVVKKMDNGHYKTPNKGILMDLATGTEYSFTRPDTDAAVILDWNVKVHDLVTFTLTNGSVSAVTLYKKHLNDGTVYSYDPS